MFTFLRNLRSCTKAPPLTNCDVNLLAIDDLLFCSRIILPIHTSRKFHFVYCILFVFYHPRFKTIRRPCHRRFLLMALFLDDSMIIATLQLQDICKVRNPWFNIPSATITFIIDRTFNLKCGNTSLMPSLFLIPNCVHSTAWFSVIARQSHCSLLCINVTLYACSTL